MGFPIDLACNINSLTCLLIGGNDNDEPKSNKNAEPGKAGPHINVTSNVGPDNDRPRPMTECHIIPHPSSSCYVGQLVN